MIDLHLFMQGSMNSPRATTGQKEFAACYHCYCCMRDHKRFMKFR